ncbi:MAG TPA: hypothetical protein VF669_00660 [Tepidisphaeraceae bacterium]|jgi:hypothetical protein
MKRALISTVVMALAFGGAPLLTGCDRTVSEDKTVKTNSDGSSSVKEKKVTENSDGGVTITEKKDVKNNP